MWRNTMEEFYVLKDADNCSFWTNGDLPGMQHVSRRQGRIQKGLEGAQCGRWMDKREFMVSV